MDKQEEFIGKRWYLMLDDMYCLNIRLAVNIHKKDMFIRSCELIKNYDNIGRNQFELDEKDRTESSDVNINIDKNEPEYGLNALGDFNNSSTLTKGGER